MKTKAVTDTARLSARFPWLGLSLTLAILGIGLCAPGALCADAGAQVQSFYQVIEQLEHDNLGQTYSADLLPQRMDRLELKILGQKQTGSLKTRLDNLLIQAPSRTASLKPDSSQQSQSAPAASSTKVNAMVSNAAPQAAFDPKAIDGIRSVLKRTSKMGDQSFSLKEMEKGLKQMVAHAPEQFSPVAVTFLVDGSGKPSDAWVYAACENSKANDFVLGCVKALTVPNAPQLGPEERLIAIADKNSSFVGIIDLGMFSTWIDGAMRDVKADWHPSRSQFDYVVKVVLRVQRDGTITSFKVSQSAGNADQDAAAFDAARRVGKVAPLPPGAPDITSLEVTFAYRIVKKNQMPVVNDPGVVPSGSSLGH